MLFISNSKLLSADCFNLDQSKILSSGNGLNTLTYDDMFLYPFPSCFQKKNSNQTKVRGQCYLNEVGTVNLDSRDLGPFCFPGCSPSDLGPWEGASSADCNLSKIIGQQK